MKSLSPLDNIAKRAQKAQFLREAPEEIQNIFRFSALLVDINRRSRIAQKQHQPGHGFEDECSRFANDSVLSYHRLERQKK